MTSERWQQISAIFQAALARPSAEREAFLTEACGRAEPALRREVDAMLAAHGNASIFGRTSMVVLADELRWFGPGMPFGSYRIDTLIAVGGMGEVYRARDISLDRDVAIKLLPQAYSSDPERLARFEREARVLAQLNHPHIGAIYGLADADGVRGLVLEFVDGQTLADRLQGPPLSVVESLTIAHQIAEALDAAHEKGIVHRDLKPANVKITRDGAVKVLDFGLAKAMTGDGSTSGVSQSPTIAENGTRDGIIAGTAAYMSPEQARGKPVDKRTDIWAFGCVLYEMLAGRAAFAGETITDILASVVDRQPDWRALPATTPPGVRQLLKRCLEKDPRRRLRDIGDARLEIDERLTAPGADDAHVVDGMRRRGRRATWAAATLGIVAAVAIVAATWLRRTSADTHTVRFFVTPPEGWALALGIAPTGAASSPLAVSPDGRRVAILARNTEGRVRLWIRALDTLSAQELAGTDGASGPFWSPDSRFIGFFAGGKLWKVDVLGGSPIIVCDIPEFRGGTWSRDGVIVFATSASSALQKVPASGGVPTAATVLAQGEGGHWVPHFLPDGRHFVYRARFTSGIYVATLDSTDRKLLLESAGTANVVYAQGHLLFVRGTTLMAQPFDTERLTLTGDPVPLAEHVQSPSFPPVAVFSASDTGVVAYQSGPAQSRQQLTWYDRTTKLGTTVGDRAGYSAVNLSPDGKRAAVSVMDPSRDTRDIWLFDLLTGLRSRFSFDPADEVTSIWSPDSGQVVFNSRRKGRLDLYVRASRGAGTEEVVLVNERDKLPWSWSPDGRFILYSEAGSTTSFDLWILPLSGDRSAFPFLQTPFNEWQAQFSPDGHWIAYVSNESGSDQVYVTPFPASGGKIQVSTSGGTWPRWRRDGKELFYIGAENQLTAAEVSSQSLGFEVSAARSLLPIPPTGVLSFYDVSPDGQRFLVNTSVESANSSPITVVLNGLPGLEN